MTLLSSFGCTPLNRNGSTAKTEASLQAKLHGSTPWRSTNPSRLQLRP
eukprot:CAMPEP_0177274016 /NCGR_PEP_ID=MMETSP0367-20130122/66944_1 /TAXON_ID=447022 ORGANISM="Scrippsiella hangoei-like, Strain SHHI-4" /NCGR_SAMPLE_ID=MMETSP0367 /ASSEMBLY_ACC=CAM_ASM_000362 /LENGTH=47 /DNA_ID= /DNA_START= /DNA_END= /DNA_ORIENTATION=